MVQSLLFKTRTPRILKVNLFVLTLIFLSFVVIILYNLILFVIRHGQIDGRITIYKETVQRNLGFRGLLLDMITIHQMIAFPEL